MIVIHSEFDMTHSLFLEYVRYCEYMSKRIDSLMAIPTAIVFCSFYSFPLLVFNNGTQAFIVCLILIGIFDLLFIITTTYILFYFFRQEPTAWSNKLVQDELCTMYLHSLCHQDFDEFFPCLSRIDSNFISFDTGKTVLSKETSKIRWVKQTENFFLVGCYTNQEIMKWNWRWRSYYDRKVLKGIPAVPFKLDTLTGDELDEIKLIILRASPHALPFKERRRLKNIHTKGSYQRNEP